MAFTKIRGTTQILEKSINHEQLADDAGILLTQLAEGAELIKRDGSVAFSGDVNVNGHVVKNLAAVTDANADGDAATVKYVKDKTAQLAAGVIYKGLLDASTGSFPADVKLGDMYKVSVNGTIDGMPLTIGDMVIANKAVVGATAAADWDRIDSIEAVLTVNGEVGNVVITAEKLSGSTITTAELNYLDGVTSGVQAQLDSKFASANIDTAVNLGDSAASDSKISSQLAVKTYVDNGLNLKLDKAGGTITGNLAVNGTLTVAAPVNNTDAASKKYVDDADAVLQSAITTLQSQVGTDITNALNKEIGDRAAADTAIQTALDAYKTSNDAAVAKEVSDRTAADTAIQTALDAYKTSNDAALAKEVSDRAAAVTAEETARKNADAALQTAIDQINGKAVAFVYEEEVVGAIDGANTNFTLANAPVNNSLALYLNGIRLRKGASNDYTVSGANIVMLLVPQAGDTLVADYRTN